MKEKERCCSVVIHCHNEEQHISHLLTGVMQQTVWDVEVIVVDSGPTATTLSIALRYLSENSVHIRNI